MPVSPSNPSRSPWKVLFFLPTLGAGGAEMHMLRVINHLDRRRFAPEVVVARGGGAYEAALSKDVPLHVLCPTALKSSGLSMLWSIPSLRLLLARLKPDLLCSVLNHTTGVCRLALKGVRKRPVFLVGLQNNVTKDLQVRDNIVVKNLVAQAVKAFREADHLVALSHGVAQDFHHHFPGMDSKVSVIYNAGVDDRVRALASETISEFPLPKGNLLVACGRLSEQKDFPTLLRTFSRLRKQRDDVTLWILGRGPDQMALEKQAESLGLGESVKFLGFQSNPFKFMAVADVFVLSSAWEGFGNVVVEAMAAGAAVVSTDCDFGPGEIIREGVSGFLCPVGDDECLARQILVLLDDKALREAFVKAGKERADDYDALKITREYEEVLQACLPR